MTDPEVDLLRGMWWLCCEVRRWRMLAVCAVLVAMVLGVTLLVKTW